MIILTTSKIGRSQIAQSLGKPEYSYYFLLRDFYPALERVGRVEEVDGPDDAVARYQAYSARGEDVVFLSISPPHQTPLDLPCPTVSLFAWEFGNLPDGGWSTDRREDWSYALAHIDGAIATSQFAADAVRHAMGFDYPVTALPAPLWESFSELGDDTGEPPPLEPRKVPCGTMVLDSRWFEYSANGIVRKPEPRPHLSIGERLRRTGSALRRLLTALTSDPSTEAPYREAPWGRHLDELELSGVTYLAVLAPADSRKNWADILRAFCWTFKDTDNATLILKLSDNDHVHWQIEVMTLLSRIEPFKCRIVAIFGYLSDDAYRAILRGSTYAINASTAEGLCLPLVEAMCAGKPVVAPRHTAMADYVDSSVAFVVGGAEQPICWTHDPSGRFLARAQRLNWQSLMEAFQQSHAVREKEPERYRAMSQAARARMRGYCSVDTVAAALRAHLGRIRRPRSNAA